MQRNRVTIKDVAAYANVSAQTVSRVYRNQEYVSDKTRQLVLDSAKKLNYVPNKTAISLRMGENKKIAVVFDSLLNIYFAIMIDYIHREVNKYGYSIQIMLENKTIIDKEIYRSALSMGAVGVISFLEASKDLGDMVKNYGVPIMILGRSTNIPEIDYVTTDDKMGGRLAAEKLLNDGCKDFAYVAEGLGITCIENRYDGFKTRLLKEGKSPCLVDCSVGLEKTMSELQLAGKMPNGVFCSSDIVAFRLMNVLTKLNIKDINIVGFDNLQADIDLPFRIKTVAVDKKEIVSFAVEKLLNKIENNDERRIAKGFKVFLQEGSAI